MKPHIIYYYQTFVGLEDILNLPDCPVTHLMVSSLHFGQTSAGKQYIHLNDYPPDHSCFDTMWSQIRCARDRGVTVMLMLGGAGGAYGALFSDYDTYYPMLLQVLRQFSCITGLELDVEEDITLSNIRRLISDLHRDLPTSFLLTMAPISDALVDDTPGLGGFRYSELAQTLEGRRIDWYNVQCYGEYTLELYETILRAGWPSSKIVMGMISGSTDAFREVCHQLQRIHEKYPDNFLGVDVWEYCNCPPDPQNHSQWAQCMHKILHATDYVPKSGSLRQEIRDFSLNKKKCKLL